MQSPSSFSVQLEPIAGHTAPVFLNHALAFLLRVGRVREEHALVARGFFVFADTARLGTCAGGCGGHGFEVGGHVRDGGG